MVLLCLKLEDKSGSEYYVIYEEGKVDKPLIILTLGEAFILYEELHNSLPENNDEEKENK